MELEFVPLWYDFFESERDTYVRITGRDAKGRRVCIIDRFEPYFFVILKKEAEPQKIQKEIERISTETTKVTRTEIQKKNFLGKEVIAIKVFLDNFKNIKNFIEKIDAESVETIREHDVNLVTKYIIEKNFFPLQWYKIKGEPKEEKNLDADFCLVLEKANKIENKEFKPKILAFDIEAEEFELGKGRILMVSLVSENFKKVLTWKKTSKTKNFVEFFENEAQMIEAFVNYVKEISPDLLVGYFSDGFDLPYLRVRAEKNKINLSLGIDGSQPKFTKGRINSAKIFGVVHVDLFRFIETVYAQYLQSETLGLHEVASELLGEGKIDFEPKHEKMKEEDWLDYFEYNLQDSVLT
ncbi:MAG: hypothetical protein NZ889_00825, partial [Candidatus Pacearchaeota archaeon]|nr:hypothetical protein [Candidatus Pacearchaeota archaeon]